MPTRRKHQRERRHLRAWLIGSLAVALLGLAAGIASPPTPTIAGPNCDVDSTIDGEEEEFLRLINDYRQENDLAPLELSDTLSQAAAWKAQHMAGNDYFAHTDAGIDRTWVQRIRDCGYDANTWLGENLAAGNGTAAGAFDQWRNSPGHNANMLNEDFNAIGIGRAYDADSTYDWYWATDFGGEIDSAPPPASEADHDGDADCNGRTDVVDAALVLQRNAGLVGSLACQAAADVNEDGTISVVDAALILQYSAGLLQSLPV